MNTLQVNEYGRHSSKELNDIFAFQRFPHQGQEPDLAEIIILGLDANYSPEIGNHPDFMSIIAEYHRDGIGFWEKYGVHHPFLLDSYPLKKNTGGVPYHRKFTWLGLDSSYASKVSFVELLPFPTTGRTEKTKFWSMFDLGHASQIDNLIKSGEKRLVILSSSLFEQYMKESRKQFGVFDWLPNEFSFGSIKRIQDTIIYGAPHFSSTQYKKAVFEALGEEIRTFCLRASQ